MYINCVLDDKLTMFCCDFCPNQFVNERLYHNHLHEFHKNESGFFVRCNINDCPNTFKSFNNLYVHRHRWHKEFQSINPKMRNSDNIEGLNNDDAKTEFDSPLIEESCSAYDNEAQLAKFILNLRASTNVSINKLKEIIIQMEELVESSVRHALNTVDNILKTKNCPVQLPQFVNFDEIIEKSVISFKKLDTMYKLNINILNL